MKDLELLLILAINYQLAKDGELPAEFGRPIAHSKEGVLITGILIIISLLWFDLSQIVAIGSISILFIHLKH